MGAVYLGRGPDGSEAAVKVIRDEFAADGAFRARFRREVEACSRVRGPRAAELLDADVDGSPMWLAVRYVPGPTLSAYVEEHGPLAADAVRSLALCLADALGAVWQAGIVHRDLKPSNVILAAEGPVLIDFGIATAADATVITQTGAVVGTTGWMSPEQLRGQPTTAASDLWGWAALLTYAASGRGPFGDGPAEALAWRMLHEPPDPTALSRLPEPLAPVVARCLQTDPTLRPDPEHLPALAAGQTVDESTAVPSIAVEHGTPATQLWNPPHDQPSGPPASQPAARRRWLAAATAGLALTAMTVLALVLYDRRNNDPDGADATSPPATTEPAAQSTGPSRSSTTVATTTSAVPPDDDPRSFYTTDGSPPALTQDCSGVVGLCLGNSIDHALSRLGAEDERYGGLNGQIVRVWNLDGARLTIDADEVEAIASVTLSIDESPQDFRAALPDGLVLGELTMQDVVTTLGSPVESDNLPAEGITLYDYRYFVGGEGSMVLEYGTAIPWLDDSTNQQVARTEHTDEEVAQRPVTSFSARYRLAGD